MSCGRKKDDKKTQDGLFRIFPEPLPEIGPENHVFFLKVSESITGDGFQRFNNVEHIVGVFIGRAALDEYVQKKWNIFPGLDWELYKRRLYDVAGLTLEMHYGFDSSMPFDTVDAYVGMEYENHRPAVTPCELGQMLSGRSLDEIRGNV